MKMKHLLLIKTIEAQFYFNPFNLKNKSFFDNIQGRIKALYYRANERQAYAFMAITEIKLLIDDCIDHLESEYFLLKKKFKKRMKNLPVLLIPTLEKFAVTIQNPLDVKLIQCFEQFEKIMTLILTAKQYDLFSEYNEFYRIRNTIRKKLATLFTQLLSIHMDEIPRITLQQIMFNEEPYQEICKYLGEIDFESLYNALRSNTTPALPPMEFNQIAQKLTQKILNQSVI